MTSANNNEKIPHRIEVRYMGPEQVEKMKQRYIQDAKERLPHYFSPEKRLHTKEWTIEGLQENGLPRDIFWRMVEYNLSAKEGMSVTRLSDIDAHIDYLASEYVVYDERIRRDFLGDEQQEQLEQLDEVFTRSFDRMANFYTTAVGTFFERNEVYDESKIMYQSISELYARKIHLYADFIRLETDYARIINTADEWLLRDSYFMGDLLRLIISRLYPQCIVMPPELYTETDLMIAGALFQSANKWLITQKSTAVSEEQLGVELGLFAMKIHAIEKSGIISQPLHIKLMKMYDSFYKYKIEDLNKRQEEAEANIYNLQDGLFGPLDERLVAYWSNKLQQTIIEERIESAFSEVIPAALEDFKNKVAYGSKLERYQLNNEWFQFYNESTTVTHAHSNLFTYKLRLNDWNYFIEKMNVDLKWQYYM